MRPGWPQGNPCCWPYPGSGEQGRVVSVGLGLGLFLIEGYAGNVLQSDPR